MSRLGVLAVWWVTCLLWSSTFLFIKLGLAEIPPFTFAWVRLAVAAAVLLPILAIRGDWRTLRARDVTHVMAAGVLLLGANYGLVYWGAQFVPSGLVAILQAITPVIALALGWLVGSEQVTHRKVWALAAGVAGVALIFGTEARVSSLNAIAGSIAITCGSACVASAYVWLKSYKKRLPPASVTTLQCIAGICALAPIAFVLEGSPAPARWSGAAISALLYLALCGSVLAFWLNYWLLERMDASAMLMMGVAEVPIAIALGAIVFGERLPPGTLVGGTSVLAGVILNSMTLERRQDARSNPVHSTSSTRRASP